MANDDYRARGRVHDMRTTSRTRVTPYGGGQRKAAKRARKQEKRQDVINALAGSKGMFGKLGKKMQKKMDRRSGGQQRPAEGLAAMVQRGMTNRANSMEQTVPTTTSPNPMTPKVGPATRPVDVPTTQQPVATPAPAAAPTPQPAATQPAAAPQAAGRQMPGAAPRSSGFRSRR